MDKLILIVSIILFSGCELMGVCNKIEISKNEKAWFLNYKNPKKNILLSQYGNTDTIIYEGCDWYYTPCNRFELGDNQYENFSTRGISTRYPFRVNLNYHSVYLEQKEKGYIYFDNAEVNFYKNGINKQAVRRYCKLQKDSLIGHDLSNSNADSNGIAKAFWSREYGIIEYELGSGEKFELIDIKY